MRHYLARGSMVYRPGMSIDRADAFVFPGEFFVQLGVHDMLKSGPSVMNIVIGQLPGPSSSLERGHGVGGQETEAEALNCRYLDSSASSRLFEIYLQKTFERSKSATGP